MSYKKEEKFIAELMEEVKSTADSRDKQVSSSRDIALLIEQNLALTEEIYRLTKKVHAYLMFNRMMGYIQLIMIFGPLILAAIYLPPMLKPIIEQYQSVLNP